MREKHIPIDSAVFIRTSWLNEQDAGTHEGCTQGFYLKEYDVGTNRACHDDTAQLGGRVESMLVAVSCLPANKTYVGNIAFVMVLPDQDADQEYSVNRRYSTGT